MTKNTTLSVTDVPLCLPAVSRASCYATLGNLTFIRGVELTSSSPQFSGLSSLTARGVPSDSQLIAINDFGAWIEFPRRPPLGRDAAIATMAPLLGADGHALDPARKVESDSEAVASDDANGAFLVSFEQRQRIWRYRSIGLAGPFGSNASSLGVDSALAVCDGGGGNNGVEAMEMVNASHLLAICEGPPTSSSSPNSPAFLFDLTVTPPSWRRFDYSLVGGLLPTDLARLPPDAATGEPLGLLIIERDYTPLVGNHIRLRRITPSALETAATTGGLLEGVLLAELLPNLHNVDNFEGLAIVPSRLSANSAATAFLVSDDNANPRQRTLLFEFSVPLSAAPITPTEVPAVAYLPLVAAASAAILLVICTALLVCYRCRRGKCGQRHCAACCRREAKPEIREHAVGEIALG